MRNELVNQLMRSSGNRKKAPGLHFRQVAEPRVVSFRRSVLEGEESAILYDGWFHSFAVTPATGASRLSLLRQGVLPRGLEEPNHLL